MLKKSLLSVLLVASVLLVFPLVVSAQQGQPPAQAPQYGGGYGRRGGGGWMGGGVSLVEATAEATGLSVEEVIAALQGGQSFADIASGAGVTLEAIADVAVAQRAEALKQAVADGRFTQEQADTMLASMKTHLLEQLNAEWTPGGAGGRAGGQGASRGRGGMRGGNRQNVNPGTCPQL
ncbi:MAG: hypothetical protein WHX52_06260 [Anaerolineae bacterium]